MLSPRLYPDQRLFLGYVCGYKHRPRVRELPPYREKAHRSGCRCCGQRRLAGLHGAASQPLGSLAKIGQKAVLQRKAPHASEDPVLPAGNDVVHTQVAAQQVQVLFAVTQGKNRRMGMAHPRSKRYSAEQRRIGKTFGTACKGVLHAVARGASLGSTWSIRGPSKRSSETATDACRIEDAGVRALKRR